MAILVYLLVTKLRTFDISINHEIGQNVQKCLTFEQDWLQLQTCGPFNPIALRKAKIVYNFGLSGCNRVKFEKDHETGLRCVHVVLDPFFITLVGHSEE